MGGRSEPVNEATSPPRSLRREPGTEATSPHFLRREPGTEAGGGGGDLGMRATPCSQALFRGTAFGEENGPGKTYHIH